jgi:hypothetical protein
MIRLEAGPDIYRMSYRKVGGNMLKSEPTVQEIQAIHSAEKPLCGHSM